MIFSHLRRLQFEKVLSKYLVVYLLLISLLDNQSKFQIGEPRLIFYNVTISLLYLNRFWFYFLFPDSENDLFPTLGLFYLLLNRAYEYESCVRYSSCKNYR